MQWHFVQCFKIQAGVSTKVILQRSPSIVISRSFVQYSDVFQGFYNWKQVGFKIFQNFEMPLGFKCSTNIVQTSTTRSEGCVGARIGDGFEEWRGSFLLLTLHGIVPSLKRLLEKINRIRFTFPGASLTNYFEILKCQKKSQLIQNYFPTYELGRLI